MSHVYNETAFNGSFIPYPVRRYNNETAFNNFLYAFMPGDTLAPLRADIASHYPVTAYQNSQINRTGAIIQDSTFVCNTRQLFDAYSNINTPVYMMNYHFLAKSGHAVHGSDLLPTFYNKQMNIAALLCSWKLTAPVIKALIAPYAKSYQSYLTSFSIFGNPNTGSSGGAHKVNWPVANASADGNFVQNVLEPYYSDLPPYFRLAKVDTLNTAETCGYWNGVAQKIMDAPGIAAPTDQLTMQDQEVQHEL